ncbi:hypothetical protein AHMF7616_02050 [Adhaeribacter pallidiroseus]|uniref:Uncharacterized protein n=1 Tax=Adhaeribacter pallidiroseus TaxID=2072847 RepID=A0A369QJM3_9BACT|nr:hypothetical protein AHMF7616_02050 [Adhaeribacter pallidiroseus]
MLVNSLVGVLYFCLQVIDLALEYLVNSYFLIVSKLQLIVSIRKGAIGA